MCKDSFEIAWLYSAPACLFLRDSVRVFFGRLPQLEELKAGEAIGKWKGFKSREQGSNSSLGKQPGSVDTTDLCCWVGEIEPWLAFR